MPRQKEQFDPTEAGIIAHSRVQVLESCRWQGTTIPVFAPYIRINLSLMEGQDALPDAAYQVWLRIYRSPDPFSVVERTKNTVRLQFDWIWLVISAHELDALFAKAEAVRPGSTAGLG